MAGQAGNSEFCFPKTLSVSQGETEGNIEVAWSRVSRKFQMLFP